MAEDSAEKQRQAEVRRKLQEEALTENIALTKDLRAMLPMVMAALRQGEGRG